MDASLEGQIEWAEALYLQIKWLMTASQKVEQAIMKD